MKRTPASKSTASATKPAREAAASTSTKVKAQSGTPVKRASVKPSPVEVSEPASTPPSESKQTQLIALLRTPGGASMVQLIALTGWQAHTVRGMISGTLRKRLGLSVTLDTVDGVRLYRIVEATA